ncbi:MAG: hypothetical protein DMF57_08875 [Acidobacteria bacterium]|nr:MAG: hypothetical protein DMF57_08875 [Acidobacteriota bacterium]
MIEPHGAIAQHPHLIELVGDEDERDAAILQLLNFGDALLGKLLIAHREHFIDQQDLRIHMHGDGKSQPHVHA